MCQVRSIFDVHTCVRMFSLMGFHNEHNFVRQFYFRSCVKSKLFVHPFLCAKEKKHAFRLRGLKKKLREKSATLFRTRQNLSLSSRFFIADGIKEQSRSYRRQEQHKEDAEMEKTTSAGVG